MKLALAQEQQGRVLEMVNSLSVSTQAALSGLETRLLALEAKAESCLSGLHRLLGFCQHARSSYELSRVRLTNTFCLQESILVPCTAVLLSSLRMNEHQVGLMLTFKWKQMHGSCFSHLTEA